MGSSSRHRVRRVLLALIALAIAAPGGPLSVVEPIAAQASGVTLNRPPTSAASRTSSVIPPQPTHASAPAPVRTPVPAGSSPAKPPPPGNLFHSLPMPMKSGLLKLDPLVASQFVGSDGRFEVDVPAGAVTPADMATAGGQLYLALRQVAPASGSSGGGSGMYSFGTFLVQTACGRRRREIRHKPQGLGSPSNARI